MSPRTLGPALAAHEAGARLPLSPEAAHHLTHVLRLREGDALTVFDGAGLEAAATLSVLPVHKRVAQAFALLTEPPREGRRADRSAVTLLQGVPKSDKLEQLARQCTELGLAALWPVHTARSVPRGSFSPERLERLRAVTVSACAQSGRADLPLVHEPAPLEHALTALSPACTLRLVAWEQGGLSLRDALAHAPDSAPCALLIGPEGGLEAAEVERARAAGFVPLTLGPRILRTETAGPALLAALSALRGDLGSQR